MGRAQNQKDTIEWIIGFASAIIVLGILAFLGYQAMFDASGRPILSIRIEQVEQTETGTVVTVAILNTGKKAASAIRISATSPPPDGVSRQLQLGYLGSGSVQRAAFLFEGKPIVPGKLRLSVDGYLEP